MSANVSLMPAREAVKVTVVAAHTVPAVAVNVAEVDPDGIVTVAGRFTLAGEAVNAIVAPAASAGPVSAKVQVAEPDKLSEIGRQVKPFSAVWIIPTLFPVVVTTSAVPTASAPIPFESWTGDAVAVVPLESVNDAVATTPFDIGVVLRPYKTQIKVPAVRLLQETFLFAAMATGPA